MSKAIYHSVYSNISLLIVHKTQEGFNYASQSNERRRETLGLTRELAIST